MTKAGERLIGAAKEMRAMVKSPREKAARALCRKAGHPEDTMFEGKPMWMSFLDEVDTVLVAIRDPSAETQFAAIKEAHAKWISERGGIGMAMFDYAADREKAFAAADGKLVAAVAATLKGEL